MSAPEVARALDAAVCAAVSDGMRRDDAEHIVRMRQAGTDPGVGLARPTTASTSDVRAEPPRPLIRELPPADPFPVEALGDVLGAADQSHKRSCASPDGDMRTIDARGGNAGRPGPGRCRIADRPREADYELFCQRGGDR